MPTGGASRPLAPSKAKGCSAESDSTDGIRGPDGQSSNGVGFAIQFIQESVRWRPKLYGMVKGEEKAGFRAKNLRDGVRVDGKNGL